MQELGGKFLLSTLWPLIDARFKSPEWQRRHAALLEGERGSAWRSLFPVKMCRQKARSSVEANLIAY